MQRPLTSTTSASGGSVSVRVRNTGSSRLIQRVMRACRSSCGTMRLMVPHFQRKMQRKMGRKMHGKIHGKNEGVEQDHPTKVREKRVLHEADSVPEGP